MRTATADLRTVMEQLQRENEDMRELLKQIGKTADVPTPAVEASQKEWDHYHDWKITVLVSLKHAGRHGSHGDISGALRALDGLSVPPYTPEQS